MKDIKMKILYDKKELMNGDETSIKVIYNNLTGKNFKDPKKHKNYLKLMSNDFMNGELSMP